MTDTPRQCHVCNELSDDWDIDRDTLRARGPTRPICKSCLARRNAAPVTSFGGPYAGNVGSKGGGASADMAKVWAGKSGALRLKCLRLICEQGPLGADRLAMILDEDEDNVSPRLSELTKEDCGAVLEKGPRTARTKRGNPAHVYQLTEAGRQWSAVNMASA